MKAMILAAGRGERMRPLSDRIPKPMLPVAGKPLIIWLIERLARAGRRELVINVAHRGAELISLLGNGADFGVTIAWSDEGKQALETAGGIRQALPLLGTEPFLVVNGDLWCDYDFSRLATLADDDLAHLVLVDNPPHHPAGDFLLHEHRVSDPAASNAVPTRLTFAGIGLYRPALFADLTAGESAPLAPLLRRAMGAGKVSGEAFAGEWFDVGTPDRLQELDQRIRQRT